MVDFGLSFLYRYIGSDFRWLSNDIHESMKKEMDFKLEA